MLLQNIVFTGIWADESDDEDRRPGFGGRPKKNQDYTSGINFISGGFKKSAEDEEVEEESQVEFRIFFMKQWKVFQTWKLTLSSWNTQFWWLHF